MLQGPPNRCVTYELIADPGGKAVMQKQWQLHLSYTPTRMVFSRWSSTSTRLCSVAPTAQLVHLNPLQRPSPRLPCLDTGNAANPEPAHENHAAFFTAPPSCFLSTRRRPLCVCLPLIASAAHPSLLPANEGKQERERKAWRARGTGDHCRGMIRSTRVPVRRRCGKWQDARRAV